MDPTTDDYYELLEEAVTTLAGALTAASEFRVFVESLQAAPDDQLKWRRETPRSSSRIAWPQGKALFDAAESTLLSAAKARIARSPYYGQRHARFARRFLESCLMGQTQVGSYVVTAYTPVAEIFPEKIAQAGPRSKKMIPAYTGREITETLVVALQAAQEAIDHWNTSSSLSGFQEAVKTGVSKEMVEALSTMLAGNADAEVEVDWSPVSPAPGVTTGLQIDHQITRLEFTGSSRPALTKAVEFLSSQEPAEYVTVTGWVNVVTRPKPGQPGVVRLRVLKGSSAGTLRVQLNEQQFGLATQAIAADAPLIVVGQQEKMRSSHWLREPSSIEVGAGTVTADDLQTAGSQDDAVQPD